MEDQDRTANPNLFLKGGADLCFIQETKMERVDDAFVQSLGGSFVVGWVSKLDPGMSGGILQMWKVGLLNAIFTFIGEGFVGICAEWGPNNTRCFRVINFYSPYGLSGKKRLWKELLMSKRGFRGTCWVVRGDFNDLYSIVMNEKDQLEEDLIGKWRKSCNLLTR